MIRIKKPLYSTLITLFLATPLFADCSYELFTISTAKNTKIIDFVEQLSDECEFSIIITDTFAKKILNKELNKTHIKNLTINEVLSIILTENNLAYTLKNNILKVSYLTTKTFTIDYILSQRKGIGSTDITLSSQSDASSSQGSKASAAQSGSSITSNDEVKFWHALDSEFQNVLNRPEDIYKSQKPIINRNAGLITVTATNKQIKRFSKYLKQLQKKVQLQVLIDVKLLSVTMADSKTTGIDWKQLYALQNIDLSIDTVGFKGISDVASLVKIKAGGTINEVVKFLQTQGDVTSISNPKVLTLNNQPALITAGTEYFYKLSSTETLTGASSGTQSSSENIQSVFAGVLLSITPEISDNDEITLIINPSLSETNVDISQTSNNGRSMPPDLNRRQLSSVVTVKDGNRIILGGLISTKNTKEENKVPILGDIPIISYLFKYEKTVKVVEELIIIIEPHIVRKENNSISLVSLGYKGIEDSILNKNENSIEEKYTVIDNNEDIDINKTTPNTNIDTNITTIIED